MNAAPSIRDLILSERLLPGSLATLKSERQATAEATRTALGRLGLSSIVSANGPNVATVHLTTADLLTAELWLGRLAFMDRIAPIVERAMPYRVGGRYQVDVNRNAANSLSVRFRARS